MRKKVLSLGAALVLIFTMTVSAASPRYAGATPKLTFNGTTAICEVTITNRSSSINATIKLWEGAKLLRTWFTSGEGTVSFSDTARVEQDKTYRLTVDYTVNKVAQPQASTTGTC